MMLPFAAAAGAILLWSTLAALGLSLSHLPPFLLTGLSTRASELGIRFPDTMTLTPDAVAPATLGALHLGSLTRDNVIASPIPSITLNAHLDDSDTNVLASPRIRVRSREKAKIHIGDRLQEVLVCRARRV